MFNVEIHSSSCLVAKEKIYLFTNKRYVLKLHFTSSTADPCNDFEQYACGKFHQNAQIPEDKRSHSVFTSELPDTIYKRGRKLLEAEDKDDDWELFRSCIKDA